jgi:uncharacterized membrane protein
VAVNPEILSSIHLFSLLDEHERLVLAERVDTTFVPAGHTVFNYGDPGNSLYFVLSGEVEISFKNDTGHRIVLEIVRSGEFFGEISLLDGGPRTASALVLSDTEAVVVDRDDLDEFLRLRPAAAMDLLTAAGRRLRETNRLLRHSASRNINDVNEDRRTRVMRIADWIAEFSGSLEFLFIHCAAFFIWIVFNVGAIGERWGWDPYPFGLLTMSVSLEAIILSVFVLLSQNRQISRERVRNDIEYDINLKAELEIGHLHEKVDLMHSQIMSRLEGLERSARHGSNSLQQSSDQVPTRPAAHFSSAVRHSAGSAQACSPTPTSATPGQSVVKETNTPGASQTATTQPATQTSPLLQQENKYE